MELEEVFEPYRVVFNELKVWVGRREGRKQLDDIVSAKKGKK